MTFNSQGKQALPHDVSVQWTPLTELDLDAVVAIEKQCYSHPWSVGNFKDAFKAGNLAQGLKVGEQWVGYYVAMQVLDEVHLLNITVAPSFQRQGWARKMLQHLSEWSIERGAHNLWLEVRASNAQVLAFYESLQQP